MFLYCFGRYSILLSLSSCMSLHLLPHLWSKYVSYNFFCLPLRLKFNNTKLNFFELQAWIEHGFCAFNLIKVMLLDIKILDIVLSNYLFSHNFLWYLQLMGNDTMTLRLIYSLLSWLCKMNPNSKFLETIVWNIEHNYLNTLFFHIRFNIRNSIISISMK